MSAQSESLPDAVESKIRAIELLTENGFSIFRQWEIEDAPSPVEGKYEFLVRGTDGFERKLVVEVDHEVVMRIEGHTRGRILLSSTFWICCAERHLAVYLDEHNECPLEGKLRVETLTPADLNLSIRWERT